MKSSVFNLVLFLWCVMWTGLFVHTESYALAAVNALCAIGSLAMDVEGRR